MTIPSAADRSQIYTELTEATSPRTAEVIMQTIVDAPWDSVVTKNHLDATVATLVTKDHLDATVATLVTKDHLDAQLETMEARIDAKFERTMRTQMIWLMSTIFAFNGLLAAWFSAFH